LYETNDFTTTADRDRQSQRLRGLLAIETGGRAGSVAWSVVDRPTHYIPLDADKRTAVTLTAAIADVMAKSRHEGVSIDVVAVNVGPGSFTGLRIGVTTAKTLAYALKCRVVAVDGLACAAGVAFSQNAQVGSACIALNAYRQQFFVAKWQRDNWQRAFVDNSHAAADEVWAAARFRDLLATTTNDSDVQIAADPAVMRHLQDVDSDDGNVNTISPRVLLPLEITAADVAAFAWRLAQYDHFTSPMSCNSNYLRDSAAEEKLR